MDRLTKLLSRMYGPDPRDARIAELEAALSELERDGPTGDFAHKRIAELEAMCATQAETIAGLNRLLDGVAVAIVGKTRLFADLPETREKEEK